MPKAPNSNNPAVQRAPSADEAVRFALGALNAGRPDEAARIAGDVLKREPRHAGALHASGAALLMMGRGKEAIAPLQEASRTRNDAEIDTQLAIALRQAGRADDALVRLKRAVKRKPPYPMAFHELGYLLFTLKHHDKAADVLRRGIDVAPMVPALSVQLGHVQLARGDRRAAKAAFARALSLNPGHGDALFSLAMAHAEDGEYEAAAALFRQCVMARPDNAGAWLNLGHCLLGLGQRDAGYDCFRAAARGGGNNYGMALGALAKSGRGRLFLRPSAAQQFMRGKSG